MAKDWSLEDLSALSLPELQRLYGRARALDTIEAKKIVALVEEHDLYREADGGLPFDHPIMLEIEEISRSKEAVTDAVAAAEAGLPPLAGFEHRLVGALGDKYGTHYTTHHAGRCIAEEMEALGWKKLSQKPMPTGSVAKTATTFSRKV